MHVWTGRPVLQTTDKIPASPSSQGLGPYPSSGNQDFHHLCTSTCCCSKGPWMCCFHGGRQTIHSRTLPVILPCDLQHRSLLRFVKGPPRPSFIPGWAGTLSAFPLSPYSRGSSTFLDPRSNQSLSAVLPLASAGHYCSLGMTTVISVLITLSKQPLEQAGLWIPLLLLSALININCSDLVKLDLSTHWLFLQS